MPAKAEGERAEQLELLSGLIHDRQTSPELGALLSQAGADQRRPFGPDDAAPVERAYIRELYRAYRRSTRLPRRLVTELAKQAAVGQARWVEARKASDFGLFAPQLGVILGLVRESAACLGYKEHPYDPLLDEYEPWMKTSEVEKVFAGLRVRLRALLGKIVASGRRPDTSFLNAPYPVDRQREFSLTVLREIGYDFQRGRLDESAHPFSTTLGRADVRLTTRYNPDFFNTGVFGTIHEAGHGLYELGIGAELADTILADGTSMGIHESQSRMWENFIGRSLPFWVYFYPRLKALFPQTLEACAWRISTARSTRSQPSLIRVEADEVTYNLHILVRFELEKRLISRRPAGRGAARRPGTRRRRSPGRRAAGRRPGRAAGHPLVHGRLRLLPHLRAGQPLRRPVLPHHETGPSRHGGGAGARGVRPGAELAAGQGAPPGPPGARGGAVPPGHRRKPGPGLPGRVPGRQVLGPL